MLSQLSGDAEQLRQPGHLGKVLGSGLVGCETQSPAMWGSLWPQKCHLLHLAAAWLSEQTPGLFQSPRCIIQNRANRRKWSNLFWAPCREMQGTQHPWICAHVCIFVHLCSRTGLGRPQVAKRVPAWLAPACGTSTLTLLSTGAHTCFLAM